MQRAIWLLVILALSSDLVRAEERLVAGNTYEKIDGKWFLDEVDVQWEIRTGRMGIKFSSLAQIDTVEAWRSLSRS